MTSCHAISFFQGIIMIDNILVSHDIALENVVRILEAELLTLNETSLETAIREAYEETGYKIDKKNICKLGSINPNSAILSSEVDIFFAKVSINDRIKGSDLEVIDIIKIDKNNIKQFVINGEIKDSFTLSALHLYDLNYQN